MAAQENIGTEAIQAAEIKEKNEFLTMARGFAASELGVLAACGADEEYVLLWQDANGQTSGIRLNLRKKEAVLVCEDGTEANMADKVPGSHVLDRSPHWEDAFQRLLDITDERKELPGKAGAEYRLRNAFRTLERASGGDQQKYAAAITNFMNNPSSSFISDAGEAGLDAVPDIVRDQCGSGPAWDAFDGAYASFVMQISGAFGVSAGDMNRLRREISVPGVIDERVVSCVLSEARHPDWDTRTEMAFVSTLVYWAGRTRDQPALRTREKEMRENAVRRAIRAAGMNPGIAKAGDGTIPWRPAELILKDAGDVFQSRRKASRFRIGFIKECRMKWGLTDGSYALAMAQKQEIMRIAERLADLGRCTDIPRAYLTGAVSPVSIPEGTYRIEDRNDNCIDIVKQFPRTKRERTACIDGDGRTNSASSIPWSAWAWAADMENDIRFYGKKQNRETERKAAENARKIARASRLARMPIFGKSAYRRACRKAMKSDVPFLMVMQQAELIGDKARDAVLHAYTEEIPTLAEIINQSGIGESRIGEAMSEKEPDAKHLTFAIESMLRGVAPHGIDKTVQENALYNCISALLYVSSDPQGLKSQLFSALDSLGQTSRYCQVTLEDIRMRKETGEETRRMQALADRIAADREQQLKDTLFKKQPGMELETGGKTPTVEQMLDMALNAAYMDGRGTLTENDWQAAGWENGSQALLGKMTAAEILTHAGDWCQEHNVSIKIQKDIAMKMVQLCEHVEQRQEKEQLPEHTPYQREIAKEKQETR